MPQAERDRVKQECIMLRGLCVQLAMFQISKGRQFWIENPLGAFSQQLSSTQELLNQPRALAVRGGQCEPRLRALDGGLAMKPTGLISNSTELLANRERRCSGQREHSQL
eukprot:8920252-Pyramimonas_sp.AAC.1